MHRKVYWRIIAALVVVAAALWLGYALGRSGAAKSSASKEEDKSSEGRVTAKVTTALARQGKIEKLVTAFGTVMATPEDVRTISVPFEARVRRVLVAPGQQVAQQTNLVRVEPSPDASLQLQDARTTHAAAVKDFEQVRQRLEMKLATKSDLFAAQQALQLAESKLHNLEERGIENKTLQAGLDGLVSKIDVQEGQIVPAGGALIEVVPTSRIQVRLGVEAANAGAIEAGQSVRLMAVQMDGAPVEGQVRMVTHRVNPASRLVDVYVSLPDKTPLLLETYVRGQIVVGVKEALVVPQAAVMPEDDKHKLFTVRDGKAVEHEVQTGLANDEDIELLESDIHPGEAVVTQGNYELASGMAVEVEAEAKAETPSTSEPSTQPEATSAPRSGSRP